MKRGMETARQTESPPSALRAAVKAVGSQSALSRLLGISQPAVSLWLSQGQHLPAEHVLKVEAATGISRHRLRPDIYPPDGHPYAAPPAPGRADGFGMETAR